MVEMQLAALDVAEWSSASEPKGQLLEVPCLAVRSWITLGADRTESQSPDPQRQRVSSTPLEASPDSAGLTPSLRELEG